MGHESPYGLAATTAGAATIQVVAGGNLQAALDAAQPGDTITLEPNATYVGNFVLPYKGDLTYDQYITIRSAAPDSAFADYGRITPAFAASLPKIKSPNSFPSLQTAPRANHYRLVFRCSWTIRIIPLRDVDAVLHAALAMRDRLGDGQITGHGLAVARGHLVSRLGRLLDGGRVGLPPSVGSRRISSPNATRCSASCSIPRSMRRTGAPNKRCAPPSSRAKCAAAAIATRVARAANKSSLP